MLSLKPIFVSFFLKWNVAFSCFWYYHSVKFQISTPFSQTSRKSMTLQQTNLSSSHAFSAWSVIMATILNVKIVSNASISTGDSSNVQYMHDFESHSWSLPANERFNFPHHQPCSFETSKWLIPRDSLMHLPIVLIHPMAWSKTEEEA